jgi:hypothetical protein
VERGRYVVDLARRQHDEVDPANRLVARELERRWEAALEALQGLQREAAERLRDLEHPLRAEDEALLRRHAHDVSRPWRASTTRPQDRKRIVRLLIDSVVVRTREEPSILEAQVHWNGGEVSSLAVARGQPGRNRHVAPEELVLLIATLAGELSDSQVARILNRRGIRTPKGLPFTANRVAVTRNSHGIPSAGALPARGDDVHTAVAAAALLGVDRTTVIRWVEAGPLKGTQVSAAAPWRLQVAPEDVRRLKPTEAADGWVTLKKAALRLGITQAAVVQRLDRGALEGVRVRAGRRSSWRINLPSTSCEGQAVLFESPETAGG